MEGKLGRRESVPSLGLKAPAGRLGNQDEKVRRGQTVEASDRWRRGVASFW